MLHRKKGRKFGRKRDQHKALLKSMARSLILHEKIKTTHAKAKELAPYVEKLITRAKKNNLQAHRMIARVLDDKPRKKLVNEITKKYDKRQGGYTRITRLGARKSDSAQMAIIEFV
ncbi:50S ribosomal protein L17 [bacterium]|nr:50S ribosomal protein L17 [bacterium]|tara:strand:- start:29 stop:376 length:348 start_codon:yes stop_codon:yes gene_type:complete